MISNESLLVWNRLSLVSPLLKSEVVQVNTIIASDSIVKLNEDSKTQEFYAKDKSLLWQIRSTTK